MAYTYQTFASLGVNLNRQKYGALDISSVFNSEADLAYYLSKGTKKDGVSQYWLDIVPYPYAGQVVATVIDGVVAVFALQEKADGTFETVEVGGKVSADEVSITVGEDGVIAIKGYAEAASGSQLVKTANGLEWQVPDTTTVEGLSTEVGSLRTDMTAAQGDISDLETAVGKSTDEANADGSLFARVAKHTADISALEGKMSGVFHFKGAAPDGQLTNVSNPQVGDVYTVGDKEYAYSGTEWTELGFTTDLSAYSTTEQMNEAIGAAKSEANTYADGKAAAAESAAKTYADGLKTALDGDIDAVEQKLGEIPSDKTVKEFVEAADAATLASAKSYADSKVGALGALAAKDEVAEADLAAALKSKLDGKADSATTLAGYGIGDAYTKSQVTDLLAEKVDTEDLGTMAAENAADYTKTEDLETALAGKYDASGAAAAVQGSTSETVASVDAKVKLAQDAIGTLTGSGVGSVSKSIDDKIAALDLPNTYATKKHAHAIADVTDLQDKLDALAAADTSALADLNAYKAENDPKVTQAQKDIDALEEKVGDTAVSTQITSAIEALDLANTYEAKGAAASVKSELDEYKTSNTSLTNLLAEAIASAQDDVDKLGAKVGTVPDGKTVVQMISDAQTAATYDDTQVKADIKANKEAIDVLNGSGAGSVQKAVDDAINKFATDVTDDGVVNSYKELIDWAAEHGSDATEMAAAISALEAIVDGIGDVEAGEKATVVAYVSSAIDALKIGDYAKVADLTALAGRVSTIEGDYLKAADKTELSGRLDVLEAIDHDAYKAYADQAETDAVTAAKAYADGLAKNYDAKGDAAQALTDAKAYADGLAANYDAKGDAAQALTDAKAYTDSAMAWGTF